jgi:hypothetical protein
VETGWVVSADSAQWRQEVRQILQALETPIHWSWFTESEPEPANRQRMFSSSVSALARSLFDKGDE